MIHTSINLYYLIRTFHSRNLFARSWGKKLKHGELLLDFFLTQPLNTLDMTKYVQRNQIWRWQKRHGPLPVYCTFTANCMRIAQYIVHQLKMYIHKNWVCTRPIYLANYLCLGPQSSTLLGPCLPSSWTHVHLQYSSWTSCLILDFCLPSSWTCVHL